MYRTRSNRTTNNQSTVAEELVPSCPGGTEIDEESELYVPILIQSYARDSEETIITITCKTTNVTQIHSEGKRSSINV
ncbi:MAG: hypothetical protein GEU26_16445 [Nitrososphaeraceae archaeon]|nr:hypothetical protein [Nitrososphaeraceae archaeon]